MVNWPRAALAFFCLLPPAIAQITDFTLNPPDPVMGELVTYTAVTQGNNQPVASFNWEYRYISGLCSLPWTHAQFGFLGFWLSPEPRPGTWEVRLTVTYQSPGQDPVSGMMLPPPPPSVITKNVTVAPATKVTIVAGDGVNAPVTGDVEFRFRVEAATRPCGPWIFAMAQERMTEIQFPNPPFAGGLPDTNWFPVDQPEDVFYLLGNQIFDIHHQEGFEGIWPLIQVFVMRSKQHLRLKFTDPCGQVQYVYLGTVTHVRLKVNDNEWTAHGTVNEP